MTILGHLGDRVDDRPCGTRIESARRFVETTAGSCNSAWTSPTFCRIPFE